MRKYERRLVPNMEHLTNKKLFRSLNWECIRVFLTVARTLSFRAAERELYLSLNTIRRRIEILENETGSLLFTRHVNGLVLTNEGRRIFISAQQMEEASFKVSRTAQSNLKELSGPVRVSVTEGIGTFWIVPRLVDFQRTYPRLIIDLKCTMRRADILRMEADISIQLERPDNPDLIVLRLGRIHMMPFAAKKYLEIYGYPKTLEDGINHKYVLQVSDQSESTILSELFPDTPPEGLLAIRTNTSSAHYWAVTKGAGIGMIPTYGWAIGGRILPIDVGFHISKDIWLAYHPDARKIKRVELTIDWIKKVFDTKKYPWFQDEFIHPDDLIEMVDVNNQDYMFEGFSSRK